MRKHLAVQREMSVSGLGSEDEEDVAVNADGITSYTCPVCSEEFPKANMLQYHYDKVHSIRDPELVTTLSKQCTQCKAFFARWEDWKGHTCPARQLRVERPMRQYGGEVVPVVQGPQLAPPAWHIATDGSGQGVLRKAARGAWLDGGW